MVESMLQQKIDIYSEKYNIVGVVKDYGLAVKLCFTYDGRDVEMGIRKPLFNEDTLENVGRQTIESYICNLAPRERVIMLHRWYIDEHITDQGEYREGHGIVTGHPKIADACYMCTDDIKKVHTDLEKGELIMTTTDYEYHCPLEYCRWRKQDECADAVPDYIIVKEKYMGTIRYPLIEPGNVLLVLANFCDSYFHSLHYVPEHSKKKEPCEYCGDFNTGLVQDSCLIQTEDMSVDIRYFPHFQNVEFYAEYTSKRPFFIENIGNVVIFAKTSAGTIKLQPGERKEVTKKNAEEKPPVLPQGDLYPMRFAK